MSRPSTEIIEKYNIIDQFRRYMKLCGQQFSTSIWECSDKIRLMKCSLSLCVCVCVCEGMVLKQWSTCRSLVNMLAVAIHWSYRVGFHTSLRSSWKITVSALWNSWFSSVEFSKFNQKHFAISVYFYNFGWSDYGVASLSTVLDMVKVMAFALQEGKIAIHCHAGLGRTGSFACSFL